MKIFIYLFIAYFFIFCKNDKKNNINEEELVEVVNIDVEQKKNHVKELTKIFYDKILNDDFVSTAEFVSLFGNGYNEGEIYLKKKKSKIDCFDISDSCESYIFSRMKEKSIEITSGLSYSRIVNFISESRLINGNQINIKLSDRVVVFYFAKDFIEKNKEVISNIIIEDGASFLEEFEE